MRVDEEYRGYRIRYRRRHGWAANILPPLALSYLRDIPFASDEEGRDVIVYRARSIIDAHIADGIAVLE